jgi:hypothetical protein
MTDENIADAMKIYLVPHQLHLAGFTTINKKIAVLYFHEL